MLRAALPLSRRAVLAPARQPTPFHSRIACNLAKSFTQSSKSNQNTKPTIGDPAPAVLPGSESKTATAPIPLPPSAATPGTVPKHPSTVSSSTIPPANVPLTPPPPPGSTPPTASTSAPPPGGASSNPPTPKKKPRSYRTYLLYLILFTALSYAGGVWYSLVSDNFHDFFTEYVPFGEESVLYFEEREFRKRFPRVLNNSRHSRDPDHRITIPSKSGLSWKVQDAEQDGGDAEKKGRHMSAVDDHHPAPPPPDAARDKLKDVKSTRKEATPAKDVPSTQTSAKPLTKAAAAQTPAPAKPEPVKAPEPASPTAPSGQVPKKMPEVNEPSIYIPIPRIDPLRIKHADEPLVQDLVKMINDIITVVNADNANGMLNSTINKAKLDLSSVGQKILQLKAAEQDAASSKIRATEEQFDTAAKELVQRLESEIQEQESKWRGEYESARQRIANTYEDRLQAEIAKINQIKEQESKNELLEQAITLKKEFVSGVKDHVEKERNGRLSQLSELSSSVSELEKLTSAWNSVIDANLQTQHLQVAVEAVRSNLESASQARPFIKELAALKEIAHDDPVVNSAIASISPISYQRGISSPAQIMDRFRRVADQVRKASLLPEDAGIASHAASMVLSKVMFKKQGRAVGDDVESVLTRTETLLEEGNLDDAAREMNSLSGWAKTLSRDWLAEVRRVLEVRQALDVISTEARLQSLKVD